MKHLSDKNKRLLIISGLGILCVILVIAVVTQFHSEPSINTGTVSSSSSAASVNPESNTSSSGAVIQGNSTAPATSGSSSQGISQVIQPDPVKPSAPSSKPKPQGNTQNPSKAPSYSSKATTVSKASEPKAGEKNSKGQVWFPGFGWVNDDGANQGTTVGSSGDELTGNKVGTMD